MARASSNPGLEVFSSHVGTVTTGIIETGGIGRMRMDDDDEEEEEDERKKKKKGGSGKRRPKDCKKDKGVVRG